MILNWILPTVNRKGHLAKVEAGVCRTGSSKEMKGYSWPIRVVFDELGEPTLTY